MGDEESTPFPRPPAVPGLAREEAPTPIPRRSSLEELRASADPPAWLIAIDELRSDLIAKGAVEAARASQADNAQQEQINELARWKKSLEDNAKTAADEAKRGASFGEALLETITKKWLTPQTIAVAIGTVVTVGAGIINAALKAKGLIP